LIQSTQLKFVQKTSKWADMLLGMLVNESEFGQTSGNPGYFQTTAMPLRSH